MTPLIAFIVYIIIPLLICYRIWKHRKGLGLLLKLVLIAATAITLVIGFWHLSVLGIVLVLILFNAGSDDEAKKAVEELREELESEREEPNTELPHKYEGW